MKKTKEDKENINLEAITSQATADAFKKALETNIPVIIKEGNLLVELFPDGSKRTIQKLSGKRTLKSSQFKISL